MGADSSFDGEITITPPLSWAECRLTPGTDDAQVRVHEELADGEFGQAWILTGVAIVAKNHCYGPQLQSSVQAIVDAHPEHEFSGFIEEWSEVGYRELPCRYVVRDRQVVCVQPAWPSTGPVPARLSPDQVADTLVDMAERVRAGDSFDGSISYCTDYEHDGPSHVFEVVAMYRVGNSMGQGGMRMINGGES